MLVFYWIIYFLLAALIFFAETSDYLRPVHRLGQSVIDPARANLVVVKTNVKSFFSLTGVKQKDEKIAQLELENANLVSLLANFKSLENENANMRRLLDAVLSPNWKFAPAHVISAIGDTLFLVSNNLPTLGTPVITTDQKSGVYVGKVEEVIGSQVKVITQSNANSKIPAIVRSVQNFDQRASGILEGRGGKIVLEQVLSKETLQKGDLVFTSGELGLPPDLLLGKVAKILTGSNTALQQAEVEPPLDISNLNVVFYITKF